MGCHPKRVECPETFNPFLFDIPILQIDFRVVVAFPALLPFIGYGFGEAEFLSSAASATAITAAAATGFVTNHVQFHAIHLLSRLNVSRSGHAGLYAVIFAL
jgi:hypothetical protein